ncbi:hypothetical protein WKW79_35545 [Variovorax robiniae]|uniref:Uncharacterized protein n=1 Tax=Variovorax robiniae TaxID=1836199 RepID=A0ABU8XLC0_9BURK
MMPAIFVLDVPEFLPLVEHARTIDSLKVSGPKLGYFRLDGATHIRLNRKALGFKPAVWHGALTGGLIGHVEHFDNDNLVICNERPAS